MDNNGKVLPTIWEIAISGIPETCDATVMGIPIAPKATGAVLAIRHIPAAYNGLKPRPTSIAAVIATGAPKPAVPSRNDPKEKAIRRACNLRSEVMDARDCLMISNCPLFKVKLNKKTAVMTIHEIGKRPYNAPWARDKNASSRGIP